MENRLDVKLFLRTHRGLALTAGRTPGMSCETWARTSTSWRGIRQFHIVQGHDVMLAADPLRHLRGIRGVLTGDKPPCAEILAAVRIVHTPGVPGLPLLSILRSGQREKDAVVHSAGQHGAQGHIADKLPPWPALSWASSSPA